MKMDVRYQFLRTSNKQPVGCVAIKIEGKALNYGLSVLNPQDTFNRDLARQIAFSRLEKHSHTGFWCASDNATELKSMHQITTAVMQAVAANNMVPSRARKAAKLWLKQHTGEKALRLAHGVYE